MADSGDIAAWAALAAALLVLVVTLTQATQQYVATTPNMRKCEKSVWGPMPGHPGRRKAVDADIRSYVTAALKQNASFVDKRLPQDLLERICTKVGDGADGILHEPQSHWNRSETLPRDLYETYHRMLQGIPANIAKDAVRLLQFLVHAKRPLTLREAVEVIATQTDEEPRGLDPKRRLFREADVLRYCPGLVSVIEAYSDCGKTREELQLAHFSVKEYLLKQDQFDIKRASTVITKTCLSYLTCIEGSSFDKIEQDFPLTEYAAKNWIDYATLAQTSEDVVRATAKFLEDQSTVQDGIRSSRVTASSRPAQDPLKHPEVVRLLLEKGANVDASGGFFANALQAAIVEGHSSRFGNTLHLASYMGYIEIVRLLLDRGADVNSSGGDFDNALHVASFRGHTEIVQLLLDKGANNTL
ncbi:hypothetical protein CHGG_09248 [Chaetomium globosum CBS 148.51]|uniref:GPI inositol-deacylase winged helix domain-containing protein n=1 Tax=Chaetomium globosum (strain ATCC 6205 / CBS 148.51 / DSM 1962 / NBRC 6347 / NRRL 1970) TaxID=306901 RepID=Q2GS06_CHAGB|nr:uncharacterized protein CHGG_09248 [Chaetomium globosum CBS 148.51]EAQ85234.1 hypothetical protein CHGG_09248 [Chaetomium globosum CBS 148.51]